MSAGNSMGGGGSLGNGVLRRRSARQIYDQDHAMGPNMTPMVDIVMVILIFFMAGTALIGQEFFLTPALPTPPKQGTGESQADDPYALPPAEFTIDLRTSPTAGLDEAGLALRETRASGLGMPDTEIGEILAGLRRLAISAPTSQMTILVRATPDVPYQSLVEVLDGCEDAGFQRVGLLELNP
jgi:biopolymer transport protein ExbD